MIKLFLYLISITLTYNIAYSSASTTVTNITHAYCSCNGSMTVTGVVNSCAYYFSKTRIAFATLDENGNYTNEQYLDPETHDPMINNFSGTYTITGLCPGSYRVAYEFNGLIDSRDGSEMWLEMGVPGEYTYRYITIEGPDEFLDASIVSTTNGWCYGEGSAEISVTGGNGSHTIVWTKDGQPFPEGNGKTSLNTLEDGTYTITITDSKGCEKVLTFTIDNHEDPIQYDLHFTNSGCDGPNTGYFEICNILPIGASVSNAVNLTNGDTQDKVVNGDCNEYSTLSPGVWRVRILAQAGCIKEVLVTIVEYPELVVTSKVKQSGCDGDMSSGRIELNITSGTAPYTYEWSHNSNLNSNIADNLSPGHYTVTVTDANGCQKTLEFDIINVPELEIGVLLQDVTGSTCCSKATIMFLDGKAGTPPYTIVWDDNSSGMTQTKCTFPATHTVTITDANGCTATEQVTNTACGVPGPWTPVVYTNPNNGIFNIEFNTEGGHIVFEMFDGSVSSVDTKDNGVISAGLHTITWNTSLSPGLYTLVIRTDGKIEHEGVLVQIQ